MALSCNPDRWRSGEGLKCLSGRTLQQAQTYLLCLKLQQLGMAESCEPNALAAASKCFKCLPPATLLQVQTYLLAQLAGVSTSDPSALAQLAKAFQSMPDATLEEINTLLLCKIAGGSNSDVIRAIRTCWPPQPNC
jgi:hypothetical protein